MHITDAVRDLEKKSRPKSFRDRKLRVAVFSGNYNYVMDGPVRALNALVGHLEKRGHEALVFAPTSKSSYLEHEGTLVSIPSIPAPRRPEYRVALGLFGDQLETLKRFSPDIVHIAAPDLLGYGALRFAQRNFLPAVASFHTRFDTYPRYYGMPWMEGLLTRYMRYFYGACQQVYPPSPSMAEELRRDGIGKDLRLWTRGVDSELFNPDKRDMAWRRSVGIQDEDVVVLFVGRLVLEKGLKNFADAMDRVRAMHPHVRALVVGDGPERARFEKWMPHGVFLGLQRGEELARAYASSDIFFNPSITETFGNVTLEAMASGVPAVCARASGSVSLVEDGVSGELCEPTVEDFARKLTVLAHSDKRRAALGAAARRRSLSYSWDAVLDDLISNYYDAIWKHREPPDRKSTGNVVKFPRAAA